MVPQAKVALKRAAVLGCALVVVLGAWGCGGCTRSGKTIRSAELGLKLELIQESLSNGLQVVMVPDHTVPVISYQTWYRVGSVDEEPGITGASHLFEHLFFKGTPKFGPKEFFKRLESKGAEVNAFTTRDHAVFYETISPTLLDMTIELEADRMANLKPTEEILAGEKLIVLEERRLRTENSLDGRVQEALWGRAFRRHPYAFPVLGYPQDVVGVKLEDLLNFKKAFYHPGNASLVIVGDFDPAALMKKVKAAYGGIPGKKMAARKIEPEPPQKEERRLILRDAVASARLSQAFHITSASDADSYALDVLANILFEGPQARAVRRLVNEKRLALSVNGTAFTPAFAGLFVINVLLTAGRAPEDAEAALDQLFSEIQDQGVTPDEVHRAAKQLILQLIDGLRTPHGMGQLIGTVQVLFGNPTRFQEDFKKYGDVTPSDVQRVAKKYFSPNNRTVVTMLPP